MLLISTMMRGELKNGQERVLYVTTCCTKKATPPIMAVVFGLVYFATPYLRKFAILPDDSSFKRWINDLLFVKMMPYHLLVKPDFKHLPLKAEPTTDLIDFRLTFVREDCSSSLIYSHDLTPGITKVRNNLPGVRNPTKKPLSLIRYVRQPAYWRKNKRSSRRVSNIS